MRPLSKKEKILVVAAGIAVAGFFVFNGAGLHWLKFKKINLNREIQLKKKLIAQALGLVEQKDQIKQELVLVAPYLSTSSEDQTPFLLQELQTLAQAAQIELVEVTMTPPQKQEVCIEYTVEFQTEATLPQIMTMLYGIQTSKNLLQISRMRLSPKTDNQELLKAELAVTKLVLF